MPIYLLWNDRVKELWDVLPLTPPPNFYRSLGPRAFTPDLAPSPATTSHGHLVIAKVPFWCPQPLSPPLLSGRQALLEKAMKARQMINLDPWRWRVVRFTLSLHCGSANLTFLYFFSVACLPPFTQSVAHYDLIATLVTGCVGRWVGEGADGPLPLDV